jgi:hypothetical protein
VTKAIRESLKAEFGDCCHRCGITEWRGKPISLRLRNTLEDGYRLLCANCFSQSRKRNK